MTIVLVAVGRTPVTRSFPFQGWDHVYQQLKKRLWGHDVQIRFNENHTKGWVIIDESRCVGTVWLLGDPPPE